MIEYNNKCDIALTVEEWEIVEDQCRKCVYWSDKVGCHDIPNACDNRPVENCLEFKGL